MADAKPFTFICGSDDFLVGRLGRERYDELAREIDDEFSRETINGFANNVARLTTNVLHRFAADEPLAWPGAAKAEE